MEWQPIDTAKPDTQKPIIVWLPERKVAVSALPFNPKYAEDGNTIVGWSGPPVFCTTDDRGEYYGLIFAEEPSHWMQLLEPPT